MDSANAVLMLPVSCPPATPPPPPQQLVASNMEGKSSPSEVLVCTTNPDKPGPPSTPSVATATPYGFTVTWGQYTPQRRHFPPRRLTGGNVEHLVPNVVMVPVVPVVPEQSWAQDQQLWFHWV